MYGKNRNNYYLFQAIDLSIGFSVSRIISPDVKLCVYSPERSMEFND